MVIPTGDENNTEEKGKKTYILKRVGNDLYLPEGDGPVWVIRNHFEGKKRKDINNIRNPYKRVANDLYQYRYGHVFIIKDYYSYYKKNKKNEKKLRIADLDKNKAICAILLIMCIGIPLIFQLFDFTSHKINFCIEDKKNEYRAEYPIWFRWGISFSIAQAFIIWGDGATHDIKKARSGSLEHIYDLQGKYTPTLLVWESIFKTHKIDLLQAISTIMYFMENNSNFSDDEIIINTKNEKPFLSQNSIY